MFRQWSLKQKRRIHSLISFFFKYTPRSTRNSSPLSGSIFGGSRKRYIKKCKFAMFSRAKCKNIFARSARNFCSLPLKTLQIYLSLCISSKILRKWTPPELPSPRRRKMDPPPLNSLKRRRRENAVNSWGTPTSSAPPQKPAAAESSRKGGGE